MKPKRNRPPGRPRSGETDQPTDKIILMAASRLFLEYGYKEVSIDDVARACGVTKATIYYYYSSKAELFTETMIQMMKRIRERISSMLLEDLPLHERLLNVAKAHLSATVDIDLDGFMRGTKNSLTDKQIRQMREAENKMYESIETAFQTAIERNDIAEVNPTFAAHCYIALLKVGNFRGPSNEGIFANSDEAAEQIVSFLWKGLFN
ncbi:MAG TPA: TetR/AcrR family transcriptional regulator [Bacillales bacterium]|nr:TetR/AcrR family transcriptional regulator [Bacillales bacterium]